MNFAAEKKYLDSKSFLSFDELYQDHQQAILNSEKFFSPNFTFKNLNFNFKKNKLFLTDNLAFIQYNFFSQLNDKLFNLTPEQKNTIDIFYLNNFSDKYYLFKIGENEDFPTYYLNNFSDKYYLLHVKNKKDFSTYFHTFLYSILNNSDFIFNDILHHFNSDINIVFFFKFLQQTIITFPDHLEEKINSILLYTDKGKSLFLHLEYCIEQHNITMDEIFLDLQTNNLFKTFEKYKEMQYIKKNLEGF